MLRGPLLQKDYRPQFSGHETFPLRYGWLKKVFDVVRESEEQADNRTVFTGENAIARFGVGKNMVASMRHWAAASGIIQDGARKGHIATTSLGRRLLSDDGLDPYMENPATPWLVHWHLCGREAKTTWFWAFSYFPHTFFERETMVSAALKLAKDRQWNRASPTTIKSDVTCFIRTYASSYAQGHASGEETLESPLTELGLIRQVGRRDGFRFAYGEKPSLGMGVFSYAVHDFWSRHNPNAQALSFEALAHEPGSPGRVLLLHENDMVDRLSNLEHFSRGVYEWSETAGLKQVLRHRALDNDQALSLIESDYDPHS